MQKRIFKLMLEAEKNHWWFKGRRFLIKKLLKKYFLDLSKISVLDAGCGTGYLDLELKNNLGVKQVVGLDISETAVELTKSNGNNIILSSLEKIPFPGSSFESVLLLDVLEHAANETKVLNEIERALKNNGLLFIFVPALNFFWSEQDQKLGHYRRYNLKNFDKLLNNNWQVLEKGYFNFFLSLPILFFRKLNQLFKFNKHDELEVGKKFDRIFFAIFKLELKLLSLIKFPWGVSLYLVAKKNDKHS